MEQVTGAPAEGKDSEDEQNAPDSSSPTGKTADQDQQILVDTGDTNWFKSTQALKHLQPVFVPIVKDKMKSLQLQSMTDFGRQLCAEATSDDIIRANDNLAQFKHLCPGTVIACQNLLNIIKGHTTDSVRFYQMLIGTDPQNWLKSPFEFARLFLKDWMRRDIHDFQECDITALCTIVKRCKPLMQIFDERKVDELRKVRNRTMHPATMSITQQEMEENINVILEFLEHIKALKATDEATKASECIKQLRTGDVSLLHTVVDRLIRGWIHDAKIEYELKLDAKNNQHQDINYMENKLARMSSAQEATAPTKQSEEQELEAKKPLGNRSSDDVSSMKDASTQRKPSHESQLEKQEEERGENIFGLMRERRRRREHVPTLIQRMCLCCKKEKYFDEDRNVVPLRRIQEARTATWSKRRHAQREDFCRFLPLSTGENGDEVHQCTVSEGRISDMDFVCFNYISEESDSTTAGENADQDHQCTVSEGRILDMDLYSFYSTSEESDSTTAGENADEVHQADDVGEITYGMKIRPETAGCSYTVAKGEDSDEKASYIDVPSTTGENADQAHQILTDEGDTNWFNTTQSLKYLQPVLLSYIEDKIIRLYEETLTDFGRQLCTEATSDDIIRGRGNVAHFKHLCPGTVVTCQNLLNIIQGHTRDSVDFYQMLKGTDPQNWLKSPFEFARLFLKDWMRSDIHDFQECDILALCTIIKRCKPLLQIFDERKLDELRNVRNRTMHPHTMSICQHEMEDHINAILDFLEHMKTMKNTDEVIKAMESITQSRTDDVRSRQSVFVRLIQGWLPGARMEYKHKLDEANNQLKDINHMENKLVRVSAAQEATALITQRSS